MAYVVMSTQVNGYLVSATDWNYIVNNFIAGVPDIFTAAGDLAYATAADVATRLAIGAAGLHLRTTGSAPAWSNIGIVTPVRLTAQFDKAASTALSDVTGMAQAIAASEVWEIEWLLSMNCAAAGGAKFAVTVPAGATLEVRANASELGGLASAGRTTVSGTAIAAFTDDVAVARVSATVTNGATPGNIQLQFAQNVASGTSSILANSMQKATRIS